MNLSRRDFLACTTCACAGFALLDGWHSAIADVTGRLPITDALFLPPPGSVRIGGFFADRLNLGTVHLLEAIDFRKLVDYFRFRQSPVGAGEFWGKLVRAGSMTYAVTGEAKLKAILDATVADLLSTQTPDGCISAYPNGQQFRQSDVWDKKYVLLGLEHYNALAPDDKVVQAMIRLADFTIAHVGLAPKVRIVDIAYAFDGIESSSILEPMVRLYQLTGFPRYLDFTRYIVEQEGGCKRGSIFEAAARNVPPREIGGNGHPEQSVAKAYETLSCFEGLVEYFRATGNVHWRDAALNYYRSVRDQEITIIGSGGGDQPYNHGAGIGEQWNNTALEQTNPTMQVMMETCATVTWMKFCAQMLRLTGDPLIVDQIELSAWNALAGAQKPTGDFYDYFQPLNGARNGRVNYSQNVGGISLSCCTANGPSGLALVPEIAFMTSELGPVINLYLPGTAKFWLSNANWVNFTVTTDYPKTGRVTIDVAAGGGDSVFPVKLRIPAWSTKTSLTVNGEPVPASPGTYAIIDRNWSGGARIELDLDLRCRVVSAPHGSDRRGDKFVALVRGPIVLARDERLPGDILYAVKFKTDADGFVPLTPQETKIGQMQFSAPQAEGSANGNSIVVIDYASAGRTWDAKSQMMTWMPVA